jgi:hypothetical protein
MNIFSRFWNTSDSNIIVDNHIVQDSVSMIVDVHKGTIYTTVMNIIKKDKNLKPYI